jgi:hypothetical protein
MYYPFKFTTHSGGTSGFLFVKIGRNLRAVITRTVKRCKKKIKIPVRKHVKLLLPIPAGLRASVLSSKNAGTNTVEQLCFLGVM